MKRAEKRDHLIAVAAELFNRRGYHAAGVDQVIAESGIAKTTLYRHFSSKDDLIVAVLRLVDERFRDDMRAVVERAGGSAKKKILATFDFLETWFADNAFHGCPFMSAAGEYGERTSPVFHEAATHKRLMLAYFEDLARAGGYADPRAIADEINLLHEGAIAVAHISGDPGPARSARLMAGRLLDAASKATNAP